MDHLEKSTEGPDYRVQNLQQCMGRLVAASTSDNGQREAGVTAEKHGSSNDLPEAHGSEAVIIRRLVQS